jgi:histidyl-tRNA synthetase
LKFKSIKGTKDILPSESHRWQYLERLVRNVMNVFNYREIRTPIFEETSLFARGIGELTDIVGKEMYTFEDRSKTLLTLKPEMTASVVRAFIEHNLGEQQPLAKVYYMSPMFRQERPQAGRLRQFHQYGAEAIGGSRPEIDAEVISLAMQVYARAGVVNTTLRINSVGCEVCRPAYKVLLQEFLRSVIDRLSEESKRRFDQNPLRILDSKDENDRQLTAGAPLMKDHLCAECAGHFDGLLHALRRFEVPFEIDGRIVRGLDYYTKTAFEITCSDLGSQDALAGGGRYDLLALELGGKQTPAVGFAAGFERLLLVMEKQQLKGVADSVPRIFLVAADDAGRDWVLTWSGRLRAAGIACEMDLLRRSIKAQMREADRQQAEFVIVAGSSELEKREFILKSMKHRTAETIREEDLLGRLQPAPDPAK